MRRRFDRADAALALLLAAVGFAWGAEIFLPYRKATPLLQDEYAYLFQAKTLAAGHLTAPSPPLPEFFEAAHLLVVPRFTAKYFPGQALLLAPLVREGHAWALPCLTLGLAAALIFLVLRCAGAGRFAGLFGAASLLCSADALRIWMTYLSQPTTATWALAAALAALLIEEEATPLRAAALATCVGMAGLTRPFVGVALGAAALVLVVRVRPRSSALLAAALPLCAAAALALIFSHEATGRFTSPWAVYAEQYMAFDGPGFGVGPHRAPTRALPAHLQPLSDAFEESKRNHTVARLPETIARRARHVANWLPTWLLFPLALIGLTAARALWFPLSAASLFFALQLWHHPDNDFFLLELAPTVSLLVGAGAQRVLSLIGRVRAARARLALSGAGALYGLLLATAVALELPALPRWADAPAASLRALEAALAPVRAAHGLVFLRFPSTPNPHFDANYNEPFLDSAPLVRALDLGPRNDELRKLFPGRPAYLLELGTNKLSKLDP